jgi:hypothetical protein
MHLITQPVHIFRCSNLAVKDNSRTNRMPRYCWPDHHSTLPVFPHRNRAFWRIGCAPNVNSSWCRNSVEDDRPIRPYHAFPVVWWPGFMIVTPSFSHLSIIFSNQRLAIAGLLWMLDLWNSVGQFVWKQGFQNWRIFSSSGSREVVVLWFFETVIPDVRRSISFCQCWFFPHFSSSLILYSHDSCMPP